MEANNFVTFRLRDAIRIFFKRKKTILFVWLSGILIASAYLILAKPIYEASASVLIKVGRENIYVPPLRTEGGMSPVVDSDFETQMNSEVEILKSRLLVEQVLNAIGSTTIYAPRESFFAKLSGNNLSQNTKDPHTNKAYSNALRQLQKNLKIEGIKKTNVIKISFRHTDPEICANVLNKLINLYLEQHLKIHQAAISFGFFDEQINKLKDDLSLAEIALNNFKKQHEIFAPEEQKRLLLSKGADLRTELIKNEQAETEAQARISYYKSRPSPNPAYTNILESLLKSESELKEAQAKKSILLVQIADYKRELNQLTEVENEFLNLQQQVELYRQNIRLHQSNLQEVQYIAALDKDKVSNVSVIDPAWPPLDPATSKGLLVILFILLGGIAGAGLALFLEYIDDRINSAEDVERLLPGLPILATIPHTGIVE